MLWFCLLYARVPRSPTLLWIGMGIGLEFVQNSVPHFELYDMSPIRSACCWLGVSFAIRGSRENCARLDA